MLINFDEFVYSNQPLKINKDSVPTVRDYQILASILLIKIAKSNEFSYWKDSTALLGMLESYFRLSPNEAIKVVDLVRFLVREPKKLDLLVVSLKDKLRPDIITNIAAKVWKIMSDEGVLNSREKIVVKYLGKFLGLSIAQVAEAKRRADANLI